MTIMTTRDWDRVKLNDGEVAPIGCSEDDPEFLWTERVLSGLDCGVAPKNLKVRGGIVMGGGLNSTKIAKHYRAKGYCTVTQGTTIQLF